MVHDMEHKIRTPSLIISFIYQLHYLSNEVNKNATFIMRLFDEMMFRTIDY